MQQVTVLTRLGTAVQVKLSDRVLVVPLYLRVPCEAWLQCYVVAVQSVTACIRKSPLLVTAPAPVRHAPCLDQLSSM